MPGQTDGEGGRLPRKKRTGGDAGSPSLSKGDAMSKVQGREVGSSEREYGMDAMKFR